MKKAALIVLGFIVLLTIGSLAVQKTPVSSETLDTTPSISATLKAPSPKATSTQTKAQKNAIKSAKNYLEFTGFSKKGLIRQLSSSAGDGYSKADATYAVNHIKVDWNEQAAKSAKQYQDMLPMSRAGLIHQLTSSAGDQYTTKQANYGADKVGL